MLHQDARDDLRSLQSLVVVFQRLLPERLKLFRRHGNSKIEPTALVAVAIACFGWTCQGTLDDRFTLANLAICRVLGLKRNVGTRQGILKALASCGDELIHLVIDHFAQNIAELKGYWTSGGKVNFVVDGTKFRAPRSLANQAFFAAKHIRKKVGKKYRNAADESKALTVQVLATVVWHLGTGLPFRWRINRSSGSERHELDSMLGELPRNARFIGDAEFVGYPIWNAIIQSGRTFLFRVGSNVRLLKNLDGQWKFSDGFVHHWPERAMRDSQPPLLLKIVKIHNGKQTIYLVTNELEMSDELAAELYARRWGIEVFFRSVKQNLGKRKLCCQSPVNLATEMNWTLLGIWAALFTAKQVVHEEKTCISQISPVRVIREFYNAILHVAYQAKRKHNLFAQIKLALLHDESNRESSKQSRNYPRKKKHKKSKPPKLVPAQSRHKKAILKLVT